MPYTTNQDLPDSIKNVLPDYAQNIFREAFNNAYEQYKDPEKKHNPAEPCEDVARKVAWAAVKKKYYKGSDEKWHVKE